MRQNNWWLTEQISEREIALTAFAYIKGEWKSPWMYHTHRDKNEMCPYCKNEDTEVVRDVATVKLFAEFYKGRTTKFQVMSCWLCSALWSYYHKDAA